MSVSGDLYSECMTYHIFVEYVAFPDEVQVLVDFDDFVGRNECEVVLIQLVVPVNVSNVATPFTFHVGVMIFVGDVKETVEWVVGYDFISTLSFCEFATRENPSYNIVIQGFFLAFGLY